MVPLTNFTLAGLINCRVSNDQAPLYMGPQHTGDTQGDRGVTVKSSCGCQLVFKYDSSSL